MNAMVIVQSNRPIRDMHGTVSLSQAHLRERQIPKTL
jgi:hypothetical protein